MATTSPYGFRYPTNSSPVNVAVDIQTLAEDVNDKLSQSFAKLGEANTFTNTNTFADVVATSYSVTGESGFLKADGTIDDNTYLTEVASLSFDGDVTGGTGEDPITLTLANSGVTAGTYKSVTVDAKGRVTAGTNPTTLAGYGITDAAPISHTQDFSTITNTPTTLSGYGITDAQPLSGDLSAISSISETVGLLKKTSANTWELDTTTYLTPVTLSGGDISGNITTGTSSLTINNSGITAGTYSGIVFNAKGLATSATRYASFGNIQVDVATTTTALNFSTEGLKTISIAANTTFTASNYAAGKTVTVRVTSDATSRTLAFPPSWKFVGTKPTSIAASKTGILTVTSFGTTEAECIAAWAVEA